MSELSCTATSSQEEYFRRKLESTSEKKKEVDETRRASFSLCDFFLSLYAVSAVLNSQTIKSPFTPPEWRHGLDGML